MASITASVDAVHAVVWIEAEFASDPAVTSIQIIRVETLTGEETNVRIHSWLSEDGDECITLVGSSTALYDTEAPLDIPVYYRAESCDSVNVVTSNEVVVPSSGRLWLKDPVRPYANVPIKLKGDANPCVPVSGVYFQSMGEETYPSGGVLQRAVNRRNGIAVVRVRHGYSSTLNLATRTFTDRDAVRDLLATGDVLFLQAPAQYGIEEVYLHVPGAPGWQRLSSDHRKQWRVVGIAFDEVDRPAGLSFGVLGTRWMDLCDTYETFAEAEAAGISWRDVMAGAAGPSGDSIVDTSWRTYAEVKSEFATYGAILTSSLIVSDNFNRVTANGWGTASTAGGAWSVVGGLLSAYSTTGTLGQQAVSGINTAHQSFISNIAGDLDVTASRIFYGTLPAGAPIQVGIMVRWIDSNNYYWARLFLVNDNSVLLNLVQVIGGVETNSGLVGLTGVNATTTVFAMRVQLRGNTFRARAWDSAGTEPILTWHQTMTVSGLTDGAVGVRTLLQGGNTNVQPVNMTFDNFVATGTERSYLDLLEGR
jgi:hypothetical protein